MAMNAHPKPGGSSYPTPKERGVPREDPVTKAKKFLDDVRNFQPATSAFLDGIVILRYPKVEYHIPVAAIEVRKH